jgi:hypothetical protein
MKTNVAHTSIQSYDALKRGVMSNQHETIVHALVPGLIYTRRQIAGMTGLETSAVAGRVNELIADGVMVGDGVIKCPITGRTVEAVKLSGKSVGH